MYDILWRRMDVINFDDDVENGRDARKHGRSQRDRNGELKVNESERSGMYNSEQYT